MTELAAAATQSEDSHRTKGLLRLTMACNERCPFCNVPAEDYTRKTPPLEATLREVDAFIDSGATTLTISGGEPTLLRKRLIEVVERARKGGISFVELQTNAVLIDEAYAAALADAGVTSAFVSLLSHIDRHHDELAGLEGAFDKCLRGIDAMVDVGIRVTLNPVTALQTQDLVAEYVGFVRDRLPEVKFISMSAVQPHGRAASEQELMPEYDRLAISIKRARKVAEDAQIKLLNPYCGLPACVGWEDGLSDSVEAFESLSGGWRQTLGLDNQGNKSHGAPCRTCAVRTRCGGAWHSYWQLRGGRGLRAPKIRVEPWAGEYDPLAQAVIEAPVGISEDLLSRVDGAEAPTVWVWTHQLVRGDAQRLLRSRCSDLALEVRSLDPKDWVESFREVRRIVRQSASLQPQAALRVVIALRPEERTNPRAVERFISLAAELGVEAVRLLSDDARWLRFVSVLSKRSPNLELTGQPGAQMMRHNPR